MIRIALITLVGVTGPMIGGYIYFVYAPAPQAPLLSSAVQRSTLRVGHIDRTYSFYVPAPKPSYSPLLFVLHGATQNAEDIRKFTGYEFERLADVNGFIVVYPEGYEENWNDCRKAATYPAKTLGIDDKGFIRALAERFRQDFGVDSSRVFAVGYSNGGHLAYRLALEPVGYHGHRGRRR